MEKLFKFLAVSAMLVIFPALSWYYLNSGLEYRRTARLAMEPKTELANHLNSGKISTDLDVLTTCKGSTCLIISREDETNDATIEKLFKQFQQSYNFQLVLLNGKNLPTLPSFEIDNFIVANGKTTPSPDIILVDTELMVRNEYDFSEDSILELVSHIALLVPRKPARDIKIKKPIE